MTYTLKAVRFVPERTNSIENKNKHSLFVQNYWITYQLENPFYLWMKRTLIFIFPGEMGIL